MVTAPSRSSSQRTDDHQDADEVSAPVGRIRRRLGGRFVRPGVRERARPALTGSGPFATDARNGRERPLNPLLEAAIGILFVGLGVVNLVRVATDWHGYWTSHIPMAMGAFLGSPIGVIVGAFWAWRGMRRWHDRASEKGATSGGR
jgi:hypothetical protein